MKSYHHLLVSLDTTIKEALEIIEAGRIKIALIVDKDNILIGTLSDGDIRRAQLNNINLSDSIVGIFNKTPVVCYYNDSKKKIIQTSINSKLYQIPIVNKNGELIGVEILDDMMKPKLYPNKVVLMVGGLGKRLRPLTNDYPKPLLIVGGKPILETIIENFKKYGFENFILSVKYKHEMIVEYFGDGSQFGVNIEYIFEDKKLGTAGSLSLMLDKLDNPFFVMNGDLLTNINCESMLDYHMKYNAVATMGVKDYETQIDYGVINQKDNEIISIEEKPTQRFLINGGIYILNPEVLKFIDKCQYLDMPDLFKQLIKENKKVISFHIREYWIDIGKIEEYERANNEYCQIF